MKNTIFIILLAVLSIATLGGCAIFSSFESSNLQMDVDNNKVYQGENITFTLDVTNQGFFSGDCEISFLVNGEEKSKIIRYIPKNTKVRVSFSYTFLSGGKYMIDFGGIQKSVDVIGMKEMELSGVEMWTDMIGDSDIVNRWSVRVKSAKFSSDYFILSTIKFSVVWLDGFVGKKIAVIILDRYGDQIWKGDSIAGEKYAYLDVPEIPIYGSFTVQVPYTYSLVKGEQEYDWLYIFDEYDRKYHWERIEKYCDSDLWEDKLNFQVENIQAIGKGIE